MGAWREQVAELLAKGNHASHRESAGHTFRERDHVRRNASEIVALEGEPLAGAPHAGLDFIHDKLGVMFIAQTPHTAYEFRIQRQHAGLALNELHDHGRHRTRICRLERSTHRIEIIGRHEFEIWHQRLERFSNRRLPGRRKRAHGAPMESVFQGDNTVRLIGTQTAAIELGELQRRFIRLRPRIAEIHMGALWRTGEFDKLGSQGDLWSRGEIVAHMGDLGGLSGHGLDPRGVCVPNGVDGYSGKEIKVLVAIDVPNMGALAMIEHSKRRAEHMHMHLLVFADQFGVMRQINLFRGHRSSLIPCPRRAPPWCPHRRW